MKSKLRSFQEISETEEETALALHKKAIVVDGSNVPIVDPFLEKAITDGYFQRMKQGGVTASNATVPYDTQADSGDALRELLEHKDWISRSKNEACQVLTTDDIKKAKTEGRCAIIFGPQNAAFLDQRLELLEIFHRFGVRVMQLTYNTRNFIGDGCLEKANAGLSNFGISLVEEMNRIGIVIDLSHCGQRTTIEAIELSKQPVVFSHAGARFMFDHPRNKTDDQIKALADRGGVIGISPYIVFLTNWESGPRPTLDLMLDQIDHVVDTVGVDYVGIGSDINDRNETRRAWYIKENPEKLGNGYTGDYPEGFDHSLAYFQNITKGLVVRGYSDGEVLKILGGNFMRVFSEVWKS